MIAVFVCAAVAARATITINPWVPTYRGVEFTTAQADASEPVLQKVFALRVDLTDPTVEFFSTPSNGSGYALEFKDLLTAPNWTALPAVSGNDALRVLADPAAAAPRRFYRMRTGP